LFIRRVWNDVEPTDGPVPVVSITFDNMLDPSRDPVEEVDEMYRLVDAKGQVAEPENSGRSAVLAEKFTSPDIAVVHAVISSL
jgi:hypothetical protein